MGVEHRIKNKSNLTRSRVKRRHHFYTSQRNQTPHLTNCMNLRRVDISLISIKALSILLNPTQVIIKYCFFHHQTNSSLIQTEFSKRKPLNFRDRSIIKNLNDKLHLTYASKNKYLTHSYPNPIKMQLTKIFI
ncbi:protein of unknown function [Pseudomonas mediterranea]